MEQESSGCHCYENGSYAVMLSGDHTLRRNKHPSRSIWGWANTRNGTTRHGRTGSRATWLTETI